MLPPLEVVAPPPVAPLGFVDEAAVAPAATGAAIEAVRLDIDTDCEEPNFWPKASAELYDMPCPA